VKSKLQNAQCLKQYCNKNNSIKLKNTVLIQENKKKDIDTPFPNEISSEEII
jgi:hypothetical protein